MSARTKSSGNKDSPYHCYSIWRTIEWLWQTQPAACVVAGWERSSYVLWGQMPFFCDTVHKMTPPENCANAHQDNVTILARQPVKIAVWGQFSDEQLCFFLNCLPVEAVLLPGSLLQLTLAAGPKHSNFTCTQFHLFALLGMDLNVKVVYNLDFSWLQLCSVLHLGWIRVYCFTLVCMWFWHTMHRLLSYEVNILIHSKHFYNNWCQSNNCSNKQSWNNKYCNMPVSLQ